MNCVRCGKQVTKWQLFLGWFWKLPLRINEFSIIWEQCCSYKCYELVLNRMLESMRTDSCEVLDLSDYLFMSVAKFITVEEVMEHIGKLQTIEWARHIVAAGYRKVVPNQNPVDKVFVRREERASRLCRTEVWYYEAVKEVTLMQEQSVDEHSKYLQDHGASELDFILCKLCGRADWIDWGWERSGCDALKVAKGEIERAGYHLS